MKRILVVDDNQENLYLLKSLLEGIGYQVGLAYDGTQALRKLAGEKFDLIVSDILMPVMDGFMLCLECQKDEEFQKIPFVFYSATYTDEMDEALALKLGAFSFIRKPIEPGKLIEIFEDAINNGPPENPEIPASEHSEQEILKLYSESLINKLEKKNVALEIEIGERKRTESALSASEKSFKTVFEQAAIGVAEIVSGTSEFIKINRRYCEITGYSEEDLKNLSFEDFTHPEDLSADLANMESLRNGQIREFSMEKRYIKKNGDVVWVFMTVSPTWNPGEAPTTHIATINDITGQKLAEEELTKSESHLRSVLENDPECVKLLDLDGNLLEMNPAGLLMLEADSFDQVKGLSVLSAVVPEFRTAFSEMTEKVKNGENATLQYEVISLKGTRKWVETNATPLRDEKGIIQSLLEVTRDITERKLFSAVLADSEDRYRDLVENSPLMILTHDFDGILLSANESTITSLRYPQNELIGMNLQDLFLPEHRHELLDYYADLREKGIAKGKSRFVTKDGEQRVWEYTNTVRTEGIEKPIVRGMATDVTERIVAERALRRSARDYRTIFEQAHDAILIFEPESEAILDVNQRACTLYGFARSEFIGLCLSEISLNSDLGRQQIEETLANGEFTNFETSQKRKDGSVMFLEVNASKIQYNNRTAIITINRDITERKEAEAVIDGQKRVLEMVALGAPISDILDTLLLGIEAIEPAMRCAILLLDDDGKHLRATSAPNLPKDYCEAIDGMAIGENCGSCETSAFRGETVIVEDIENDPLWENFRPTARKFGLRACWSSPIFDSKRNVLGTFAIYCTEPSRPSERQLKLIELATGSAAIAIFRAKSVEALQSSERRLKDAQDAAKVGDWEYCLKSGKIIWSDSMYKIYEVDPELGPPDFEKAMSFYVPEDRAVLVAAVDHAIRTGDGYSLDLECKLQSGREMYVSAICKVLRDDTGEVIKLYGIAQDITERKIAEKEVEYQAHLLDTVQQSVCATDIDGKIIYWNQYATTLTGVPKSVAFGKDIFGLVFAEFPANTVAKIKAHLVAGKTWEGEYEYKVPSGNQFHAYILNSPVFDKNGAVIGFIGITVDITDRKKSELALKESEERLRTLFDHMIDGFYYSSSDGKFLDLNPAMVKMFGYSSKEEMLDLDIGEVLYFSPEDRLARRTVTDEEKLDVYRMRHKDGSEIWVEDNGRYILDDDGNVLFHEGVLRDVTERRLAEIHLKEASERLVLSQEVARVGTFEWNVVDKKAFWSTTLEEMFGMEIGEYSGSIDSWKKFIHPEDYSLVMDALKDALRSGDIFTEYRIILSDGTIRWFDARAKVFYDSSGKAVRMIGVHMDITQRKQAGLDIIEANSRAIREYENLLDILGHFANTVGSARDIEAIFAAVVDFAKKTVPSNALVISILDEEHNSKPIYFWQNNQEQQVSEIKFAHLTKHLVDRAVSGGEVVVSGLSYENISGNGDDGLNADASSDSILVAPMKIKGDVIGVIAVFKGTSGSYENEHQTAMRLAANLVANAIENVRLIELEHHRIEELKRSQKLESVGRLAGGIAHDFNNMLTAINGYSELVLKRLSLDDPIRPNILEIKKAGDRSAELTRQLLAFSRKQILQLKVMSLNDVVSDTMLMLKRLIGENIILKTNLDSSLGLVESDHGQLSQVIINLLVNARDAIPESGGEVEIGTTNFEVLSDSNLNFAPTEPGSYVLISVRDSGAGMDEDTLGNIFEPFFTTKKVGKGTGLGLATVYGIIKQSKGHIFVDSNPNQGTIFRIYLPRVDQEPKIVTAVEIAEFSYRGDETILIVEDEPMVRTLTQQVLEECGYSTFTAANGVEALSICKELNYELDLVLSDIVMPQMGGRELGERLREIRPSLPMLFTSGYADDEGLGDYILENEANFIAKPFTFDALARKVREFLDFRKKIS